STALAFVEIVASFSLSDRLKAARFSAMSADLAAARAISSIDFRHLLSGSICERIHEQWPMMLVNVLFRSSATDLASCVALLSTFCLGGAAGVASVFATRLVSDLAAGA